MPLEPDAAPDTGSFLSWDPGVGFRSRTPRLMKLRSITHAEQALGCEGADPHVAVGYLDSDRSVRISLDHADVAVGPEIVLVEETHHLGVEFQLLGDPLEGQCLAPSMSATGFIRGGA